MEKRYIHTKTGNEYSLITDKFMFKQNGAWLKDLVLYKTEYDNPDGEYFARTKEDFFANFKSKDEIDEEYKEDLKYKELCCRQPYGVMCEYEYYDFIGGSEQLVDSGVGTLFEANKYQAKVNQHWCDIKHVRPILRKIENMTDEEKATLDRYKMIKSTWSYLDAAFELDFFNEHHIDYRGAIFWGAAVELNESNNFYPQFQKND